MPCSQEPSISGQHATQSTSQHEVDQECTADSNQPVENQGTVTTVGGLAMEKTSLPSENYYTETSGNAVISEGAPPVKEEPTQQEPLSVHAPQDNSGGQQSAGIGTGSPEDGEQRPGPEDSHSHYTTSISSSVFSDDEDACGENPSINQPVSPSSSAPPLC